MMAAPNILQRDLIGLTARVVRSANSDYMNIHGKVIDETRNTIAIMCGNKKKMIIKETAVFHITLPDGSVLEVDGKVIVGRPENRIKRQIRRRW
jgi:ribonuclease P protein subunit POP4